MIVEGDRIRYIGNSIGKPYDDSKVGRIYTITKINKQSDEWTYYNILEEDMSPNCWNIEAVEDECGKCNSRCRRVEGKCSLYSET
jgi:hypothetical protein